MKKLLNEIKWSCIAGICETVALLATFFIPPDYYEVKTGLTVFATGLVLAYTYRLYNLVYKPLKEEKE